MRPRTASVVWLTGWFVYPPVLFVAACVTSKRLHDRGRSGWWAGLVLLASEDMRDTRAAQDLRLPSPAVKAVYVLYTPMRFLCAAHFVAALALFASKPHPVQNNDTLIAIYSPHTLGGIVAMVGVASIFFANELDSCPVERL